jgi:predicted nucleic acid-binding Zn ribbon protein
MVPMSAVAYRGDGFFEFDIRQGGPGAEGAAHGVLDVAEHGSPEVL